jgi:broad specificity phosphatase PhoE
MGTERTSTIFLVRHGETDWNRSGRIMGELPIPLNPEGAGQAERLAAFLRSRAIGAIYSSPAVRAHQTAETLAAAFRLSVTVEAGLTEIGVGEWAGRYWHELAEDINRRDLYASPEEARPPGGETLREVQARAVAAVERARGGGRSEAVVLVSHADVVRAIVAHYLGFELRTIRQVRVDHASLTALELKGSLADLLFLNYVPASPRPERGQ